MKYILPALVLSLFSVIPSITKAQDYLLEINVRGTGVFAPIVWNEEERLLGNAIGYNVEAL